LRVEELREELQAIGTHDVENLEEVAEAQGPFFLQKLRDVASAQTQALLDLELGIATLSDRLTKQCQGSIDVLFNYGHVVSLLTDP
jgi:hypothetical protein